MGRVGAKCLHYLELVGSGTNVIIRPSVNIKRAIKVKIITWLITVVSLRQSVNSEFTVLSNLGIHTVFICLYAVTNIINPRLTLPDKTPLLCFCQVSADSDGKGDFLRGA